MFDPKLFWTLVYGLNKRRSGSDGSSLFGETLFIDLRKGDKLILKILTVRKIPYTIDLLGPVQ